MQTLCSAGATALLVSSTPAYCLANGGVCGLNVCGWVRAVCIRSTHVFLLQNMQWWQTLTFVLLVGWLGIAFAIPTKRLLINQEMLRFPSGCV